MIGDNWHLKSVFMLVSTFLVLRRAVVWSIELLSGCLKLKYPLFSDVCLRTKCPEVWNWKTSKFWCTVMPHTAGSSNALILLLILNINYNILFLMGDFWSYNKWTMLPTFGSHFPFVVIIQLAGECPLEKIILVTASPLVKAVTNYHKVRSCQKICFYRFCKFCQLQWTF